MTRTIDESHVADAYHEAMKRYPHAADGLAFFYVAAGLGKTMHPTPEILAWAEGVAKRSLVPES